MSHSFVCRDFDIQTKNDLTLCVGVRMRWRREMNSNRERATPAFFKTARTAYYLARVLRLMSPDGTMLNAISARSEISLLALQEQ